MTSKQEQCMYCHENADDGYLYEDDIYAITKHLYGKPQQVKWVGKNLSNYEADYDYYDEPVCKTHCYQDCKIVCTSEEKYFLVVDGKWTTYIPINCCPICRRDFNEGKNKMKIKINNDQVWKLGDIIIRKNDPETIAMIVQDDDEQYCAMDISPNHVGTYSTDPSEINAGCCSSIDDFKKEFQDCWRKVDAELNIKL